MNSSTIREQAAREAQLILDEFWDGVLPVDPIRIAKELGIRVIDAHLPPEISGAIRKKGDDSPSIYLEARDHPNRKRFSCAHELGHYIENAGKGDFDYIDYRSPTSSPREHFANEFGARLLMPAPSIEALKRRHGTGLHGAQLAIEARRFGVSTRALELRIKNSS